MSAMRPGLKIQRGRHQDVRELLRAAGIPRWLRERLPAVMEGESVVMIPAVLPWLEHPLIGDNGALRSSDPGWGLSLMMTSHQLDHRLEGWIAVAQSITVDNSRVRKIVPSY